MKTTRSNPHPSLSTLTPTPTATESATEVPRPHPASPRRAARVAVVLAALALAWTGCESPVSRQPIGATPVALRDSQLAGTWHDPDGKAWHVRVADPAAGQLEVVTVNLENDQRFELERFEVLLRSEGDATLFNLRSVASIAAGDEPFLFGRCLATDKAIILFPAAADALHSRLLADAFGGEIKTNVNHGAETYEILVTNRFDRLAGELATPAGWQLLDTAHPWVFTRTPPRPN